MASRGRENKEINKSKFTIVLTNYNDEEYLEESLVSIFDQTYNNIELIITDDASKNFNKNMVEEIFKKYSPNNITELKFVINKENIGTVKTVNEALKLVTGEYVLFFASDDKLASTNIIQNYVDIFNDNSINAITSNWILCDENLKFKKYFQKKSLLSKFNKKNVKKQYIQLCKTNIYGAGSTCYRKSLFDKYGNFDESFKYLEDWPLWLKLTLNNERIYYANLDGLLHRDGGISHDKNVSKVKVDFFREILDLYKNSVLKNINSVDDFSKVKIINSYLYSIEYYSKYFNTDKYLENAIEFINNNKKFKFITLVDRMLPKYFNKLNILLKDNRSVPISFILTIALTFILSNIIKFNDANVFLLCIIILYIIIYYFTCSIINVIISKRGK